MISFGQIVKDVILFMANQWTKEVAIEIFGKVMGEHFWNKWAGTATRDGADYATMRLFYEMTTNNLEMLADYAVKHYGHE